MKDQVKDLLKRNGYMLKLVVKPDTGDIEFVIPDRTQEPTITGYSCHFLITDNKVYITLGPDTIDIDCPTYACRCLVLVYVKNVCEYLGFDTNLLEFYANEDKITESDFCEMMFPPGISYTDKMRKQEDDLQEILARAINAIIPFHESFYFEAQQMGVGLGFNIIKVFAFGENE